MFECGISLVSICPFVFRASNLHLRQNAVYFLHSRQGWDSVDTISRRTNANSPRPHLIRREPQKLKGVLVLWRLSGPDIALSDSLHGNGAVMKRTKRQSDVRQVHYTAVLALYILRSSTWGTNDHPARTTESRTAVDSGEPRCEYGEEQKERMNRVRS
jgi:hypothetical protein